MRRTAALTSSRDSACGPIRLRRLFADIFGNNVLSQLSLRLRAAEGYENFDARKDGWTKVILKPGH